MPKRNASGSGTIRQRKDGRWEGRYTVGRDPGTGRQVQKSVYGDTQKEVRQKLTQTTAAIDEGAYTEPSRLTLGAWLDIWLEEYNKEVKPRTLSLYKGQCEYRIKPSIGAVKLSQLAPHDVQKFLNRQAEAINSKPALSPKSIKNVHGILHKALQQAVDIGYLKTNPSTASKLPRIEKKEIKPLDSSQINAFLVAIRGHRFEALYMVDLFTGMRQSEILGLTWDCIQGETIYIYRQLQRINGSFKFMPLKNDKTRRITPAPIIMRKLKDLERKQKEQRLFVGEAWCNDKNLVFTNEIGEHLRYQTVYKHFKFIVKKMGIPNTRFHDLRHSYAVASLRAGDDVKTVQENLGHHTAAFTLDVYGHVTEEMKKESASRMDKFIQSVLKV